MLIVAYQAKKQNFYEYINFSIKIKYTKYYLYSHHLKTVTIYNVGVLPPSLFFKLELIFFYFLFLSLLLEGLQMSSASPTPFPNIFLN